MKPNSTRFCASSSSPRASFPVSAQNSRCRPTEARYASRPRTARYEARCAPRASSVRPSRTNGSSATDWLACGSSSHVLRPSSVAASSAIPSSSSPRPKWYSARVRASQASQSLIRVRPRVAHSS